MFSYIAGSPLVLMGFLGLSPQGYAAFFACTAASLTAGAWTSGRCAGAGVPAVRLLWLGLGMAAFTATLMSVLILSGSSSLKLFIPLLVINLFCRGVVSPTAQHLALDPMRHNAGTAAGAVGVLQILFGALASVIVATLMVQIGPIAMTGTMAGLAILAFVLWAWLTLGNRARVERSRHASSLEGARVE